MFRHGYQSWSPSGWATFGVDEDPSRAPGAIPLVVDMHHADPAHRRTGRAAQRARHRARRRIARPAARGSASSAAASTTARFGLRRRDGGLELWAEAFLGGIVVEPRVGTSPALGRLLAGDGDVRHRLDAWAASVGSSSGARVRRAVPGRLVLLVPLLRRRDRARCDGQPRARRTSWPFDVFQIDDGFQPAIGDWLATNDKFASSLDELAAAHQRGRARARPLDRSVPRGTDRRRGASPSGLVRTPRVIATPASGW